MIVSSHTRETAGGGRGIVSNANGDVQKSILDKRHTASTDNVEYENEVTTSSRGRDAAGGGRGAFSYAHGDVPTNTTTTTTTRKKDNATVAKSKERKSF